VVKAKSGDTAALLSLFDQYKLFILKTANTIKLKNYDYSDLLQLGYITIINAVVKYKIGKHNFSSYVYSAIKNTMYYTLRENKGSIEEISLNTPINDNADLELMDSICGEDNVEDPFFHKENLRTLRSILKELEADELELIIMLYYSNYTLKRYSQIKNINYITCMRKRNKILSKLRGKLED